MASIVTFNGSNYVIPATGDTNWGNNVSSYLIAIAAGALQKTGGAFTLSAETDFGGGFGLRSLYYKARNNDAAASGIVRLGNNGDAISFRNAANSADLSLLVNSSDQLTFNGVPISGSGVFTASRAVVTDGSGNLTSSSVTSTEVGYLSGVTSALQTQLNTKVDTAGTALSKTGTTLNVTTVPVANGGTNAASFTAYSVLCGGTTSTGTLQSVASVGSSGQVLTSNGAGVLPTFQNVAGTGTVNSGTANQLAYYPSSTNAVSSLAGVTVTEVGYLAGVTSAIQTQLNAKAPLASPTFTGTVSAPTLNLSGSANALSVQASVSGNVLGTFVDNQSNTADSDARNVMRVAGTSAGDPYSLYQVIGGTLFTAGIDNSDGDKYKVSNNSVPGTNDYLIIDPTTTAVSIKGTNTNDSATAGFVGEVIKSRVSTPTAFPTSGDWGDLTSISLTAGDWLVSSLVIGTKNVASWTSFQTGISTTSGNSASGLVFSDNQTDIAVETGATSLSDESAAIPSYQMKLASTTTVYLKVNAAYSGGTAPSSFGRISAVRIR